MINKMSKAIVVVMLLLQSVAAEEVERISTVAYVSSVDGKPWPLRKKAGAPDKAVIQGMGVESKDEIQVDRDCHVTLIYRDGRVNAITGPATWNAAVLVLTNTDDDKDRFRSYRMAKFFHAIMESHATDAGARGGETPPTLQLFCASLGPESADQNGSWTGSIFWSEYSNSPSNHVEVQFWRDSDLLKAVALKSELVESKDSLSLYHATFSVSGLDAKAITSLQVGDIVRRGLGNSNPLDWQAVWRPTSTNPSPRPLGNPVGFDQRLAEGMLMELQDNPCGALGVYLKLHQLRPADSDVNASLAQFFNHFKAGTLATWYAPVAQK
jgi:hypothetical protein